MSVKRARAMRKMMTPQELSLWLRLRELRASGRHFRRQSPEADYILDFVCRSAKLIVEIDGLHHAQPAQATHDARRDAVLSERGFRVLRFSASDIESELDGVISAIVQALAETGPTRRALRPRHPPRSGEGKTPRHARLIRMGLRKQTESE